MLKRLYGFLVATFAIAAAAALLSLILDIWLRPYIISSYVIALRIYAHNFVADSIILCFLICLVIISALLFRLLVRRYRDTGTPWPLVFGLPTALLAVFIVAVHLNTTVLPSFHAPLSKKVNVGLIIAIPFLATGFTYFAYFVRKLYRKKGFIIVVSAFTLMAVITTIAGYLLPIGSYPSSDKPLKDPPNVLIITIDALRRDHVSYYGEGRALTPNIDGFAERSIAYERAYTVSPWTIPSMYSMHTSRYPSVHGTDDYHRGNDRLTTLAQVLKSYGYTTEAYVANSIMDRELGFGRGFDRYLMYEDTSELMWIRHSTLYLFVARITGEESYFTPPADTTSWLTEVLTGELSKKRDRPFFIWAHYLDPHGPLTPPLEYAEKNLELTDDVIRIIETGGHFQTKEYGRALYEAEVEYVDDSLSRVFGVLEENGLYDNTLIIVTSDHGEEFFEHGKYGHARTHYNEVMAIPLFIYVPGEKCAVCDSSVTLMDIMPTVLGYVGGGLPDGLSGRDMLGFDEGKMNGSPSTSVFFDRTRYDYSMKSLCSYPFTLTRTGDEDYKYEMVDIRIGIGPDDIVAEPDAELFAQYRSELDRWAEATVENAAELGEASEVEMDNIRKERLEGLGYF